MYTFDGILNRLTLLIVLLLAVGLVSSCDDTPIVGGGLSPDDVQVHADTVLISNLSVVSSPSFSGNLPYVTAGRVNDPVFGEVNATALLRPSISRNVQVDTIGENAVARLSLNISSRYGSETAPGRFQVVEIGRSWRSTSWRYDSIPDLAHHPDMSRKVVGEFTLTESDSITVRLSDEWTGKYREIFLNPSTSERDSLYRADLPGLAIVPAEDTGRMFSVQVSRANLLIQSGEGLIDLTKEISSWAVSLDKEMPSEQVTGTSMPVFNTRGSMLQMEFDFSEEFLGTTNFSRVELALYEDTLRMSSGVPEDFRRPDSGPIQIYFLEPDQINFAITAEPRFQSNRRSEDNSFRVNATNLTNDQIRSGGDRRNLYAVIGSNDGRFQPLLISGSEDSGRQPKLLITSISKEQ